MPNLPPFKTFRRCPRCGHQLVWRSEHRGEPRRQTCPHCGYRVYHNPIAAVEVYFVRRGRLLLVRRMRPPRAGFWDVPGGFLEVGEDPVRGVRREVREEMNVTVTNLELFGAYGSGYYFQRELTSVVVLTYVANFRGRIRLNHENSESSWVPLPKAHRLAFLHQQRAIRDLRRRLKEGRS